jgi:hypothetical protein
MRDGLLNTLLYFPDPTLYATPAEAGLAFEDVEIPTDDGERLHAWWVPSPKRPSLGHVLHCHGNGGNIAGRIDAARRLAEAGFDVLLFDYRGYGRSSGTPGPRRSRPGSRRCPPSEPCPRACWAVSPDAYWPPNQ